MGPTWRNARHARCMVPRKINLGLLRNRRRLVHPLLPQSQALSTYTHLPWVECHLLGYCPIDHRRERRDATCVDTLGRTVFSSLGFGDVVSDSLSTNPTIFLRTLSPSETDHRGIFISPVIVFTSSLYSSLTACGFRRFSILPSQHVVDILRERCFRQTRP